MIFDQNNEFFIKEITSKSRYFKNIEKRKTPAAAFCRTRSSEEVTHIILPVINMNIFVVL